VLGATGKGSASSLEQEVTKPIQMVNNSERMDRCLIGTFMLALLKLKSEFNLKF
jgi:hypothetical protein